MFGVYDILETVGQGGMGVVYRAQDTALDRIVALKVLKEDLRQSKQIAARFQREAEAIASLNHPNIVHIYSVGAVGRIPYIAMEFITGAPLSAVMKRTKSIPWKRALHIAEQVAEALACAHDSHIIHRDIKPGNILLAANDRAYVTDFGIAKVLTAETQLTVEGSRLGTPHYMSPERCSKGDITLSSDLYSLGVVMFQMLSGRLPYEASSPVELIRKIVASPPARLSEMAPDLPDDVERLVAYLLEKKPADRPKSAADVARMCRRVIEGEPLFDDDGVATSIKDFRENMPTPSTTSTHIDSALGEARGLASRARRTWRAIPPAVKLWAAGAVVILAMAGLGQWTVQKSYGGYALATVNRWDQSTSAWSAPTAPAEWAPETPGVNLARLQFPEYALTKLAPRGPNGFSAALWRNDTRDPGSAIVIVDGPGRRVRVAVPPSANENAPHMVPGGGESSSALFHVSQARRASGVLAPAILMMNTDRLDDSSGRPLLFLDDMEKAVGAPVAEVLQLAVRPRGDALAVAVRGEGVPGVHVVGVILGGAAPETTPLLLGAAGISSMVYDDAGSLYIARHTSAGWSCVRVQPGRTSRQPEQMLDAGNAEITQVHSDGALVKIGGRGGDNFEWRGFDSGVVWTLGNAYDAAVLPGGDTALVTSADRRGSVQLWRVRLDSPDERVQLTFLDDGIAPEFSVSYDGHYVLGSAASTEPPALVLIALDEIATGN